MFFGSFDETPSYKDYGEKVEVVWKRVFIEKRINEYLDLLLSGHHVWKELSRWKRKYLEIDIII
jgi:hypothetical protein